MNVITKEIRHAHIFCGLGGGAKGFNAGNARVGNLVAKFRCIGGIDNDKGAIADFNKLAGVPGKLLDLFTREQYFGFHGTLPPPGWSEVTIADFQAAFGYEAPHILFLSAPCKGFSGLLSEAKSKTGKYQALNQLALRGLWLSMEAWKDDPPEFILFENVPRIQNRGRHLLDQITQLLHQYGYATAETTHDCGEFGGLAQSRKRFLMVARHRVKVPPFLYEPIKKPLRAVGQVLEKFPMPGDELAGAMHRLPSLQWKTWVRLAFVKAGYDWRSLQELRVTDGVLSDYLIVPDMFRGAYGVKGWNEPAATVTSKNRPSCGASSVADPRWSGQEFGQYGVRRWDKPMGTVSGQAAPGGGPNSIADPRPTGPEKFSNEYRVVRWDRTAQAVTSAHGTGQNIADPRLPYSGNAPNHTKFSIIDWDKSCGTVTGSNQPQRGALSVADPRARGRVFSGYGVADWHKHCRTVAGESYPSNGCFAVADPRSGSGFHGKGKYKVTPFDSPVGTVIGGSTTGNGAFAVADPRPRLDPNKREHYLTGGHYGVVPWNEHAYAVTGLGSYDNGHNSVADPRIPEASERVVCVIRALDDTWHRPFTTLELAALQGLVDPEEHLELQGLSDSGWRERIGNAVPPGAARAIASEIGRAILLAWSGETFALGATPIWVRPVAVAISVPT